ncbi:hypothetical protein DFH09DRAFT_1467529 [Mycena vulgaris]|nr:hypothetical protein DFH09DRAFT_1467529 [Mycena vulgaris]
MPSVVQNIDVNSPLVQYSGQWVLGGADGDPEIVKVVLDGETFGPFSDAIVSVEQFQVDLFNRTGMAAELHTLTISNLAQGAHTNLNLDYFTWTNNINSLESLRLQDDSPAFSYHPPTAWISDITNLNLPGFDGGTGHITIEKGATVAFTFTGDRVALYGAIGSQGAPYTVQIDNASGSSFNAQRKISSSSAPLSDYLASQMLFYTDNLQPGNHTVTITANLVSPTQDFTIDYAVVDGTVNTIPSGVTIPTQSSTILQSAGARYGPKTIPIDLLGSPTHSSLTDYPSAEITGLISSTAALGLFSGLCLIYIFYLRRRLQSKSFDDITTAAGSTAKNLTPRPPLTAETSQQSSALPSITPFLLEAARPRMAKVTTVQPPGYDTLEGTS